MLIACQVPGSPGIYLVSYRTCLCKQVKNKVITVLGIGKARKGHEVEPYWSQEPPG